MSPRKPRTGRHPAMAPCGVRRTMGACCLALAAACAQPSPGSDRLVAVLHEVLEKGWSTGDVAVFDTTMADSVTFHYAGRPRRMSRDDMAATVLRWRAAFPDLRMEADDILLEGEQAALRLRLSGTHEGEWLGVSPTRRRVEMSLMMFVRFEDGRIVELWESDDQLGLRRQLGLTPWAGRSRHVGISGWRLSLARGTRSVSTHAAKSLGYRCG